jgi:hypothetical protein
MFQIKGGLLSDCFEIKSRAVPCDWCYSALSQVSIIKTSFWLFRFFNFTIKLKGIRICYVLTTIKTKALFAEEK